MTILAFIIGALTGSCATYLIDRPKLEMLRKLTDRDERGRFKK